MKSLLIYLFALSSALPALAAQPNFIIILTDDQGYNDLGCFGSENIATPNIDRMAAEGRKFTNFLSPSPLCSPSRAGLLTGCYPKRIGMEKGVLFPFSTHGLNPAEYTIADHFKTLDYSTACIGKWHLGHQPEVLPRSQGFDSYFGIPYSNDMNHPDNKGKVKPSVDESWLNQDEWVKKWNTPLIENEEIIELPVNQRTITRRYTDKAIEFVTENKETPFFLYLAHSMPHIPLFVPEDAYDPDPKNAYKCVIEHIDAEVGRLVKCIEDLGLAENTYIIFTSDNGPWTKFKNHAGSAKPLRGAKMQTFEGGQRVPCVMWAPGHIPAGTSSDAVFSSIDLLPSFAALADSELPAETKIDGIDLSATITGDPTKGREEFLYYASKGALEGIRKGDWKLLIQKNNTMLFDLSKDISESKNLAQQHPERVAQLTARMKKIDDEITANARPVWGKP
ncbi:MAG: sulfatase [Akkermansiaceae bacterium]|nr:sulfatase [Akkermansiaceae bacterium]MDP4778878.1 sulfatase [Akkermansiaceae bacterium]